MSKFKKPDTEAEAIAATVCGAYLMVVLSDGRFEQIERVGFRVGLVEKSPPPGVSTSDLDSVFDDVETAFAADYDKAAEQVLVLAERVRTNGIAKRAVITAARSALMADGAVTGQEELAMSRLGAALGLKKGEL